MIINLPMTAPIISSITQISETVCQDRPSTVVCNLFAGNGNLTYNWTAQNQPSYIDVSFSGNTANLSYNGNRAADNSEMHQDPESSAMIPVFALTCTASNSAGSHILQKNISHTNSSSPDF